MANLLRYNYFREAGAFTRDESAGVYRVNMDKMRGAVDSLSEKIIRLQGDGDYAGATQFVAQMGVIGRTLEGDLNRIAAAGIPVDIVFEQ